VYMSFGIHECCVLKSVLPQKTFQHLHMKKGDSTVAIHKVSHYISS